jgi:hypothetical protein
LSWLPPDEVDEMLLLEIRNPCDDDDVIDRELFGLSSEFIRLVHEARRRFCITLDGVVRKRSLTGVLKKKICWIVFKTTTNMAIF